MQPAAASPDPLRWDLSDLYAGDDDPALERDLAAALAAAEALAAHRGLVVAMNPEALAGALAAYESLLDALYRPGLYAQLRFAADTADAAAQALYAKTREASAEIFTRITFLDVEIKAAPDDVFAGWADAPALAAYRHYLLASRRHAPHTLSEAEENIVTLKSLTGASAWAQLYDETLAAVRVPLDVDNKGTRRDLTLDEARALRASPDRDLRARATRALHEAHAARSHVLHFVFNTILQDHRIEIDLRKYDSPIAPTCLADELSPAVVESLMAATEANYPLAQRYYRLKARALGLADFATHDLLAPLEGGARRVSYDDGKALVLDSFRSFSPTFAEIAARHFDARWIDVMPRPGKRGGAFCAGAIPSLHPYVLTNYNDRLEDVATLAHELGHAIHFTLAGRQRLLNFHPTTPMVLDIAAVQYLYGANTHYHAGDDTYTFNDANNYHETLWDAGGTDTIRYDGTISALIDLNPGDGSFIGQPVYVQSNGVNVGDPASMLRLVAVIIWDCRRPLRTS